MHNASPNASTTSFQSPPPPSVKDEEDDSSVEEIVRTTPPPDPSTQRSPAKNFIYEVLLNGEQQAKARNKDRIKSGKDHKEGTGDWFQSFLRGVASELDNNEPEGSYRKREKRRH